LTLEGQRSAYRNPNPFSKSALSSILEFSLLALWTAFTSSKQAGQYSSSVHVQIAAIPSSTITAFGSDWFSMLPPSDKQIISNILLTVKRNYEKFQ
jgi:hypothetical protein